MASKYEGLGRHLGALQSTRWPATFGDVEAVLGSALPPSARKYPVWWSNDESHSQASAWMNAGWRTSDVNVRQGTVVFRRSGAPLAPPAGDRHRRFRPAAARPDRSAMRPVEEPPAGVDATAPGLAEWGFRRFDSVEPEAWAGGRPKEFMPQKRYKKAGRKPLNRNGHGPFCRFPEPELPTASGVYVVVADRRIVAYVGMAKNDLRQRWQGYARIQPANCYKGGQSTNCKINNAILLATRENRTIDLWIRETDEPQRLESALIREFDPPWNGRR